MGNKKIKYIILLLIILLSLLSSYIIHKLNRSYNNIIPFTSINKSNINKIKDFRFNIINYINNINNYKDIIIDTNSINGENINTTLLKLKDDLDNLNSSISSPNLYTLNKVIKNNYIYNINTNKVNLKRINNIKDSINNKINFIYFLRSNNKSYYIKNNKIIYNNYNFFEEYIKYNINIPIEKDNDIDNKRIPILMYHEVNDDTWGIASLFIKINQFEQDMKYLSDNGYTPIFLSEIDNAYKYDKPIILTFDDGYIGNYYNAFRILKKYLFKANMFIISNYTKGGKYVTVPMLKEMRDSQIIELGSHTLNHSILSSLSKEEIEYQLKQSKINLENMLGISINTIAYPCGEYNFDVLGLVSKYYDFAVSTNSGYEYINTYSNRVYELNRISVNRNHPIKNILK